ncbi:conjugal transfer protein [Viridibacillus arvi]|uniref:conjugal transfer protein n=1 Tax=Viridibacillus arvi TaxID=263475 RepID=UPI003D01DDAA
MKAIFKKSKVISGNIAEISEQEKIKKELKKKKRQSSVKPKGFVARKTGLIVFWCVFGFMVFFVFVNVFGDKGSAEVEEPKMIINKATSIEAVQYAIDFSKELYTWKSTNDGIDNHTQRIKPYLATSLDSNAGIEIQTDSWNSTWKSSEVKEIKEISEHLSQITLSVKSKLVPGKKSKGKKVIEDQQYITFSVAYDGKTYGIYDLPRLANYSNTTTLTSVVYNGLQTADTDTQSEVNQFLPTFFKVYIEDTKDKLDYLLTDSKVTYGLNGTARFVDVSTAKIYQTKEDDKSKVIAFVEVVLENPSTKLQHTENYQLTIKKEANRFVVAGFDELTNVEIQSTEVAPGTNN